MSESPTITESCFEAVEFIGSRVMNALEAWGKAWVFLYRTLRAIITPPFRMQLFLQQMYSIGVNSTLVIALIGGFTGAVLAVQGNYTLSKFGATAYTGSAVALSLIRELGPVLTALMVIGRAGSAITAEIGIMRITEQIDALKSMAVDPMKYLMAPRMLAGIVAMPLLAGINIVVGIAGGYIVGVGLLGLSPGVMIANVSTTDVYSGFVKSIAFGFIFGWTACYKGYTCGFGAVGVNRATTQSVVTASVAVLVVDYFLTSILTRVLLN